MWENKVPNQVADMEEIRADQGAKKETFTIKISRCGGQGGVVVLGLVSLTLDRPSWVRFSAREGLPHCVVSGAADHTVILYGNIIKTLGPGRQ